VDVELVPATIANVQQLFMENPPIIWKLVPDVVYYWNFPLRVCVCTLPHQLLVHFSIFRVVLQKVEQYQSS
jgi:hypothetical protein